MNNPKNKLNILLIGIILLFLYFLFVSDAQAVSYDYYVDKSYIGDGEGTRDKPFNKISDAIDASSSNSKIFVKEGDYNEKIEIKKGLDLYGENKSNVSLSGGVEMDDDSSINNLTIEGGETAVLIFADADVEIISCIIKKFGKMGVDALPGSGKMIVKNSSIYGGEGKGMYIEMGRKIEISGNNVYGNGEEGIDVRARVSGFIENNNLHDNGESGIEIIIGSSNVQISGNNIKKNGASGIATQFYQETKKTGEINIKGNTIIANKKYGLDCSLPSGGRPDSSYWSNSIDLLENDMEGNYLGSINDYCKMIDAIEVIEGGVTNENDENIIELKNKNALIEEEVRKDEAIRKKVETIGKYQDIMKMKIAEQVDKINSTSKLRLFFFGVNPKSLDLVKNEMEINKGNLDKLKNDLILVKNEEIKTEIQTMIESIENKANDLQNFINEKEENRGIVGWFLKIFRKRE